MVPAQTPGNRPQAVARSGKFMAGNNDTREISRIWQGFMTARFTLGLVLLALQGTLYATGAPQNKWLIGISMAYFASTLTTGLFGRPRFLGSTFNRAWILLVGVDVIAFSALQFLQHNGINYTPLFALPILLTSVLGSLRLALGTAAGVTMLLLGGTYWTHMAGPGDSATFLAQAALSGAGYFAIALLANQLSTRLASEGMRARSNQAAANVQRQINSLVIESLPEGVLIVDAEMGVRSANPAAKNFLSKRAEHAGELASLLLDPAWADLAQLARNSFSSGTGQKANVLIQFEGQGSRHMRVQTRITDAQDMGGEVLCVLFLQDQRELEARMRTERLASMGRMSTAVAHEIRNPLAAISQANALLDEDLTDVHQKNLTRMVSQNAQRLAKIVEDILNASQLQQQDGKLAPKALSLNEAVARYCKEWLAQNFNVPLVDQAVPVNLHLAHLQNSLNVAFDNDHLRRILVNLLDNAKRYASKRAGAIQVHVAVTDAHQARLSVWSDGAPMDQGVERHLFEPFFSSEIGSTGLGLYICRELCESHGAQMAYQRARYPVDGIATEGNEFVIIMGTMEA